MTLLAFLAGCGWPVKGPERNLGPPVVIVNADYVVLQSMSGERILDLGGLDPRTAELVPDRTAIMIETNASGAAALHDWTAKHLEERLAVLVDGRVVSTPIIKTAIDGAIVIDGDFTPAEAEAILARIKRGGA